MKTFKEKLSEVTDTKIYFVGDELWVAYGQGSGSTSQFPSIKRAINNKSSDKNYDSNVDKILKYVKNNKAMKTNSSKTTFMYEIPEYPIVRMGEFYDIWGGSITPKNKLYMVVNTDGVSVVLLFESKNEALAWVRSTS